ncbi:MAG TPA: HDOD domain-containing protein, partial [Gemmataceae bacterium]|nr:HDOD domain-containing protein [Gemmataceae bacterium]
MPALHASRFDELKATNQLPSPTGVALAILRLAESDRTTALDIAQALQADPALSGRVLKIANSAYSGRTRPAASVREAVTQLGVRLVRNVALGFSLISQHGRGACRGFDYAGFWSRSLATAVAAQAASHHTGRIAPAEAFTCGLLAQVGRLALASVYAEDYSEVLARADAHDPAALGRLERDRFATDHNELTAALLADWGLPAPCIFAAQHHEDPAASGRAEDDRTQALARLLDVAARMAAVCVADGEGRAARVPDLFAAGEQIGIPTTELIGLCDRVAGEWQEWGHILQVDTRAVPPFAALAERARGVKDLADDEPADDAADDEPLTIVVVDDDAVALRLLTAHLKKAGHSVHGAGGGEEGLRLVLEVNPQLVITDGMMPGLDGTAVVKALRQTKVGRQFYIIMLTGHDDDEAQVKAFEAGADDYVVKPFCPRLLAARLRACARVVRLQEEVRRDKEELRRCMAELGVANRRLQQAALTDALTGLYNRRYALDRLDREWHEAVRSGRPLAVMVVDIDHFKRVNDTHGHDVGDRVLQATANVLRASLRQSDVVCRMGGEEFLIIGPGMDREAALVCGERLRANAAAQ